MPYLAYRVYAQYPFLDLRTRFSWIIGAQFCSVWISHYHSVPFVGSALKKILPKIQNNFLNPSQHVTHWRTLRTFSRRTYKCIKCKTCNESPVWNENFQHSLTNPIIVPVAIRHIKEWKNMEHNETNPFNYMNWIDSYSIHISIATSSQ